MSQCRGSFIGKSEAVPPLLCSIFDELIYRFRVNLLSFTPATLNSLMQHSRLALIEESLHVKYCLNAILTKLDNGPSAHHKGRVKQLRLCRQFHSRIIMGAFINFHSYCSDNMQLLFSFPIDGLTILGPIRSQSGLPSTNNMREYIDELRQIIQENSVLYPVKLEIFCRSMQFLLLLCESSSTLLQLTSNGGSLQMRLRYNMALVFGPLLTSVKCSLCRKPITELHPTSVTTTCLNCKDLFERVCHAPAVSVVWNILLYTDSIFWQQAMKGRQKTISMRRNAFTNRDLVLTNFPCLRKIDCVRGGPVSESIFNTQYNRGPTATSVKIIEQVLIESHSLSTDRYFRGSFSPELFRTLNTVDIDFDRDMGTIHENRDSSEEMEALVNKVNKKPLSVRTSLYDSTKASMYGGFGNKVDFIGSGRQSRISMMAQIPIKKSSSRHSHWRHRPSMA